MKGKKFLDLNFQKNWSIGASLFIVLAEHRIESLDIHHSKVVHDKKLSGRFVGEMSGQNVVVATESRVLQHLVNIFRLSIHG